MEIIYPNDFVRFFNEDEEVDEVGEFEVLPEDTENSFERYYTCLLYTSPSPRD